MSTLIPGEVWVLRSKVLGGGALFSISELMRDRIVVFQLCRLSRCAAEGAVVNFSN